MCRLCVWCYIQPSPVATLGTDSTYSCLAMAIKEVFLLLARLGKFRFVWSPCNFTKIVFLDYSDPVQGSM